MGKSKKEDSKVFRRLMCLDITEQKKKQVLVNRIALLSLGMMKIIGGI